MDSTLTLLSLLFVVFIFIVWVTHSLSPKLYPSTILNEAKKAYDEEKWDRAIALCSQAIQLEPSRLAFDLRGCSHFSKLEWELAAADFTSVIELGGGSLIVFVNRGKCWLNLNKYEAALADFNEAIRLEPSGSNYFKRAVVSILLRDFEQAIDDLTLSISKAQTALELHPGPNSMSLLSSRLAYRAETFYKKGDLKAAIADMDEAIKIKPSSEYFRTRGTYHQEDGNQTAALIDYQKIVTVVDADHLQLSPELYAVLKKAYKDVAEKKWDEAILGFSQVLKDKPVRKAFYGRGDCHYQRKEWELALADFTAAIEICPTEAAHYYMRGKTHMAMNAGRKAHDDLTLAIALARNAGGPDPYTSTNNKKTLARYLTLRSSNHHALGQWNSTMADINDAILLDATISRFSTRGWYYASQKNYSSALLDWEHALTLNDEHAPTHNNLAWTFATCYDPQFRNGEKAVHHALKAHKKNPTSANCIDTVAAAYAEAGDFPEAVKFQKMVFESNPPEGILEAARRRLALYEQGLPYREEKGKEETVEG